MEKKRIKRIALVESKAVKTHVFSRKYSPRLGLPILSAILRKTGYEVEIFFQELQPLDFDHLKSFDMVGISALTSTVVEAYRIADVLKNMGQMVVMGGPHASGKPDEALEHCHYVVRGEGEITFQALLSAINDGDDLETVPGISYIKDGKALHNPSSIVKVDMEQLPGNDFSSSKAFDNPEEYPGGIMFSRGCPYDCNFCSVTTTFGRKYRYKSTQQILDELKPFNGKPVAFIDDNFAANPKKTKALLKAMLEQKIIPSRYNCQIRVNAAEDDELMDLMKRTGCRVANIGLESVNPATLKNYHKGQSLEQIVAAIKGFQKQGIAIHGMFVLGSDEDTDATITETVNFAIDMGIDTIQLCALTPFPGTAVHDQMSREGRILHYDWTAYDGLHVVVRPKNMTPYELQSGIVREMKRFYSIKNSFKYSPGKGWRVFSRLVGWNLVNRWDKENRPYYEYLKSVS
jgi:radical SAM superfamily enzyme YgiQ (UPF0313 family)